MITEARITGRSAAKYTLADVPSTHPAGGAATMKVTFDPQGQEGHFEATLDLISNSTADRHTLFDLAPSCPTPRRSSPSIPSTSRPIRCRTRTATGQRFDCAGGRSTCLSGGRAGSRAVPMPSTGQQRLVAPININPASLPQLTMGAWVKTASLNSGLRKVIGHDDGGWDR